MARTFVFNAGGRLENVVERNLLPDIRPALRAEFDGSIDAPRHERNGVPRTNEGIHQVGLSLTEKPSIQKVVASYESTPDKFKL